MCTLIADKGYDIINRGARPVIPNRSNRTALHRFNKRAYRGRNVIERCFCRLKDLRRVATRYDKLSRNFLAAIRIAGSLDPSVRSPLMAANANLALKAGVWFRRGRP
jgi:transposase